MTKIAFWRKVKENIEQGNYGCIMIKCKRNMDNAGEMCPLDFDSPDCLICRRSHSSKETLALAEAYIKRHESKSKKKDHILDTTKKVTRPNFRKYLRDNIDMKVRVTPELSEELQSIMELEEGVSNYWNCTPPKHDFLIIRTAEPSAGYSFIFADKSYGLKYTGKEYNPETDTLVEKVEEPKPIKTVGIDNSDVTLALTPQHEPTVKENLSVPQPVKFEDEVPEYVYIVYASVIRCYVVKGGFKKVIDKNLDGSIRETFTIYAVPITEESGEWLDAKGCYRTPEEALQVAKKLWGSK